MILEGAAHFLNAMTVIVGEQSLRVCWPSSWASSSAAVWSGDQSPGKSDQAGMPSVSAIGCWSWLTPSLLSICLRNPAIEEAVEESAEEQGAGDRPVAER